MTIKNVGHAHKHPEMVLRRNDIACFRADWNDKVGSRRAVAQALNISLDSMVLLDDSPFERALVRQELPMVAVPEVPTDPALVPQMLVDAGYFEAVAVTDEERSRASQYHGNRKRESLKAASTDLSSYLRGLEMQILWRRFDKVGLQRIVQLIGKTNQFNLRTRRYTADDVIAIIGDDTSFGLQLRLLDRFDDNAIIAIAIGRMQQPEDVLIDTWLMSCRVLGRQVECATLNLIVAQAQRLGAKRLVGEYIPSGKNDMVRDHYSRLGFKTTPIRPDGRSTAVLDLAGFEFADTFISVREG
jgi:FkbH-like protein